MYARAKSSVEWFFRNFFSRKTAVMILANIFNAAFVLLILVFLGQFINKVAAPLIANGSAAGFGPAAINSIVNQVYGAIIVSYIVIVLATVLIQSLAYGYFNGIFDKKSFDKKSKADEKPDSKTDKMAGSKITSNVISKNIISKNIISNYLKRFFVVGLIVAVSFTLILAALYSVLAWQYTATLGSQAWMSFLVGMALMIVLIIMHINITILATVKTKANSGTLTGIWRDIWSDIWGGIKAAFSSGYVFVAYLFLALIYFIIMVILAWIYEKAGQSGNWVVWLIIFITILFVGMAKSANFIIVRYGNSGPKEQ